MNYQINITFLLTKRDEIATSFFFFKVQPWILRIRSVD